MDLIFFLFRMHQKKREIADFPLKKKEIKIIYPIVKLFKKIHLMSDYKKNIQLLSLRKYYLKEIPLEFNFILIIAKNFRKML